MLLNAFFLILSTPDCTKQMELIPWTGARLRLTFTSPPGRQPVMTYLLGYFMLEIVASL